MIAAYHQQTDHQSPNYHSSAGSRRAAARGRRRAALRNRRAARDPDQGQSRQQGRRPLPHFRRVEFSSRHQGLRQSLGRVTSSRCRSRIPAARPVSRVRRWFRYDLGLMYIRFIGSYCQYGRIRWKLFAAIPLNPRLSLDLSQSILRLCRWANESGRSYRVPGSITHRARVAETTPRQPGGCQALQRLS